MRRPPISVAAVLTTALIAGCGASPAAPAPDAAATPDASFVPLDAGDPYTTPPPPDLAVSPSGAPYPFVLVHGMVGFKNIGPLTYFYNVADTLTRDGHVVYTSQQDPLNDSAVRGQQLQAFVMTVLAATGKAKVNLIAHSQGGFDARYVASVMGDRIESVTTIASPMGGDPIADVVEQDIPGPLQSAIAAFADLYGDVQGFSSDLKAQVANISTKDAQAFFAKYPDDTKVAYYSVAGRSERSNGDLDCVVPQPVPFVSKWDDSVNPLNPLLAPFATILDTMSSVKTHDGLVPAASARHGRFLGCIPADHLDEVGQIAGQSPGAGNAFDYLTFYRDLASWLVAEGH